MLECVSYSKYKYIWLHSTSHMLHDLCLILAYVWNHTCNLSLFLSLSHVHILINDYIWNEFVFVFSQVPRQVRCLGKERLVLLVLDPVVVSPWEAEGEAGSPDHLALEETASLVL